MKETSSQGKINMKSISSILNDCRWLSDLNKTEGGIHEFARSYEKYGVFLNKDGNIEYREWAPDAKQVSLV
jgi:hypothetical protein